MGKQPSKEVLKLRNAMLRLMMVKWRYRLSRGELDSAIQEFLSGRSVEFDLSLSLIPNDVIFMRELLDLPLEESVIKNVEALWDNGENHIKAEIE